LRLDATAETDTPLAKAVQICGQQLGVIAIAMLTSKGASGVAGAAFVTLAATLAVRSPMSSAIVATTMVSAWEGELDRDKMIAVPNGDGALSKMLAK
jgi:hypothetical protein